MRGSLRLFGKEQREVCVKSEFEREAGVIAQAGGRGQQSGRAAQVAIAAIVALHLGCGGGGVLIMAAIMANMMVLHPGLYCRRGVVVTAERHPGRGEPLQRKPQQQKAEDEIAQAVPHDFFGYWFSCAITRKHKTKEAVTAIISSRTQGLCHAGGGMLESARLSWSPSSDWEISEMHQGREIRQFPWTCEEAIIEYAAACGLDANEAMPPRSRRWFGPNKSTFSFRTAESAADLLYLVR